MLWDLPPEVWTICGFFFFYIKKTFLDSSLKYTDADTDMGYSYPARGLAVAEVFSTVKGVQRKYKVMLESSFFPRKHRRAVYHGIKRREKIACCKLPLPKSENLGVLSFSSRVFFFLIVFNIFMGSKTTKRTKNIFCSLIMARIRSIFLQNITKPQGNKETSRILSCFLRGHRMKWR